MRKEHILWTAANAQVTQSDREELWRQVKVAMDAGEPLPADAVSKLPSLCEHCGAGGESGGFKVPGVGSQAPVFAPTLVFHGVTNERVAESIVARGFVEPGDDLDGTPWRRPARWVAFGQGHYASRDLATAAQYGFADAGPVCSCVSLLWAAAPTFRRKPACTVQKSTILRCRAMGL